MKLKDLPEVTDEEAVEFDKNLGLAILAFTPVVQEGLKRKWWE